MKNIDETIICAGFGGQGIMILGKVIAEAAMAKCFNVTWLPSYGAEVRGGTAHSMIRISSRPIGSPEVFTTAAAIIMNGPSLDKFEKKINRGGILILNTSLISGGPSRKDVDIVRAPLTEEAAALGNIKVANMIAAGIYSDRSGLIDKETLEKVIIRMAGGRKELIPINMRAIELGIEISRAERRKNG